MKEVKNVIMQNSKFLEKTVDMNKAIIFFGVQEGTKKNSIYRDKKLNKITDLLNVIR